MPSNLEDVLAYYARPGPMTDPKEHSGLFDALPAELPELVGVLQGLLLHVFWAQRYGVVLADHRKQEVELRAVDQKLARILELDPHPLIETRPVDSRLVSNCRDFATVLCAMLRHQGVPARARCGFGTYFGPDPYPYTDHWVCEVWKPQEGRWVLVDSQLDALQCRALHIDFDPLDVPHDRFILAGKAWQMCRRGESDPDAFGIFQWHGLGFVRGDLVRDFLSLNKIEILPWDGWDYMLRPDVSHEQLVVFDRIAALTLAGDGSFDEVRSAYDDTRFHPPADWHL